MVVVVVVKGGKVTCEVFGDVEGASWNGESVTESIPRLTTSTEILLVCGA